MSIQHIELAYRHGRATGAAHAVLVALADYANSSGCAWPAVENLARKCRLSVRTTQRSLAELVRLGDISVHTPGGGSSTTVYRCQIVTPVRMTPVSDCHPRQNDTGVTLTGEGCQADGGGGVSLTGEGCQVDTQSVIEPSVGTVKEPKTKGATLAKKNGNGHLTLKRGDLRDDDRMSDLLARQVVAGKMGAAEADELRWFALAEYALDCGDEPEALFASLYRRGQWDRIRLSDEDRAAKRLKHQRV